MSEGPSTLRAEIADLMAQTAELEAETAKISREPFRLLFTLYAIAVVVVVLTAV